MNISMVPQSGSGAVPRSLDGEEATVRAPAMEGATRRVTPATSALALLNDTRARSVRLSVHEATNRVIIHISDRETGDLIAEIPPEKYLDMVATFIASLDVSRGGTLDRIF